MAVQPYLFFNGRCDEAIEFYKKALGAKVNMLMRYKDSPDKTNIPPGMEDKVMHGDITILGSTVLLADGHTIGKTEFKGFTLTMIVANESEAQRVYAAVSEGGQVEMPLTRTFFSPAFGMCSDKFGIAWMVYATQ